MMAFIVDRVLSRRETELGIAKTVIRRLLEKARKSGYPRITLQHRLLRG